MLLGLPNDECARWKEFKHGLLQQSDSRAEPKMVSALDARGPETYMGLEVSFFDGHISGR